MEWYPRVNGLMDGMLGNPVLREITDITIERLHITDRHEHHIRDIAMTTLKTSLHSRLRMFFGQLAAPLETKAIPDI